jgi:predicted GNAT family acetyltransferase
MDAVEFAAYHAPTLEADEVRHCLLLAILARAAAGVPDLALWTLGGPGRCAVQMPGMAIVFGEPAEADCRRLAEITADRDYRGVVGPDLTAEWFADRARGLGLSFGEPIRQQLQALSEPPRYPGAPGRARLVTVADAALFVDWMVAFHDEATPHDPPPDRERLTETAGEGRFSFWVKDGTPVSLAGIVRRTRNVAAIAGVYTPPALRGHGYAGSVTAAVVEAIFGEGRKTACLYTDLRNPYSNRCYARIGFKAVSSAMNFPRIASGEISRGAAGT